MKVIHTIPYPLLCCGGRSYECVFLCSASILAPVLDQVDGDHEHSHHLRILGNVVLNDFKQSIQEQKLVSVAAMNALVRCIRRSSITYNGLFQELEEAITCLKNVEIDMLAGRTNISVLSGCDLF